MKISSKILLAALCVLVAAMAVSNILIKKEYDKIDKHDVYWNFAKILQQPFNHLAIEGGNFTNIAFEQSEYCYIGVNKYWQGYDSKQVRARVVNDTLFVTMLNKTTDPEERDYARRSTLVRISAPGLLSINLVNTNLNLVHLRQEDISMKLSGKSSMLVDSYLTSLNDVHITENDSSKVVFQVSPDLKNTAGYPVKSRWQDMHINSLDAAVRDLSSLDMGHAQIGNVKLDVDDAASVTLSGKGLGLVGKNP